MDIDLSNKKVIKDLLKSYGLWAKRGLGQNFLIDKKVIEDLINTAELTKDDIVLEIGPGLGILTREFCKRSKKVIAVEKDEKMTEILRFTSKDLKNLEIINDDILRIDLEKLISKSTAYKAVSNLPFYISSLTFRKFLESERKPENMALIVQKEIAEKVTAKQGNLNILGISVQLYAEAEIIRIIKSSSFWPEPKVEASVLKLTPFEKPRFEVDPKIFFRIVKAGFGGKRKKLVNSLSGGLAIAKGLTLSIFKQLNIDENVRAEDLSLENWNEIYQKLKDVL